MAKGYVLIPDDVMAREDLTAAHKLIIGILARLQGDQSWCWPGYGYLASASGLSRRQVIRLVDDLALRGDIVRMRHGRGKSNTYSVPWATSRAFRKLWALKRKARREAG